MKERTGNALCGRRKKTPKQKLPELLVSKKLMPIDMHMSLGVVLESLRLSRCLEPRPSTSDETKITLDSDLDRATVSRRTE